MRNAVGLFSVACGLIVIWAVGNYGYSTADDPAVKWNMAFLFGVIAAGALFGHAVAVRCWHISKLLSLAIYLVCGSALVINLSNSLGALASRNSRSEAEMSSKASTIRDDRNELARLQKALDKLGVYVATDQASVDAAKRAMDAASTAKDRECGNGDPKQRGRFCRDKEDTEKAAADVLTKATAAKAVTDRATRIETDMRPIRERLRLAGPVQEVNVQGNALAKLFRLPDAEAGFVATLQQFVFATVVELLIMLGMVVFEVLGRWEVRSRLNGRPERPVDVTDRSTPPTAQPEPVIPERPRPHLAVVTRQPVGAVVDYLHEGVEIVEGQRLDMVDAYIGYQAWSKRKGLRPVSVADFSTAVEEIGLPVREIEGRFYLMTMQLMPAIDPASLSTPGHVP